MLFSKVLYLSCRFKIQAFFISKTFMRNARLKMAKSSANAEQYLEAELSLFDNYSFSSSTLSPKNNRRYSKKWRYMINGNKKMRPKMKNRSQRYDINRPRPWYGPKCTKYKVCLSIIMFLCVKQHLSNI